MALSAPLISLEGPTLFPDTDVSATADEYLHIQDEHNVTWVCNGILLRSFTYPKETVSCASLANFHSDHPAKPDSKSKAAVIFVSETVYIYQSSGESYVRSIPLLVKKAFPFERGLVLERDTSGDLHDNVLPKFFTLTDLIMELGLVSSSSTSSISPLEELIHFGSTKNLNLCLTRHAQSGTITVYHVRQLFNSKSKGVRASRRYSFKRRSSSLPLRNPDDSGAEADISTSLERRLSFNMVENPITVDRMASGEGYGETLDSSFLPLNISGMKKEAILTPIETVECHESNISAFALLSGHLEAVALLNRVNHTLSFVYYRKATGPVGLPVKEDADSISAVDAVPVSAKAEQESSTVLILTGSGELCLYNPFLKLKSTCLEVPRSWGNITCFKSSFKNVVSVETDTGIQCFEVVLDPQNEMVQKCFAALDCMLEPVSKEYLKFLWAAALGMTGCDDVAAFVSAIFSCTLDFGPQFLDQTFSERPKNDISCIIDSQAWDWCLEDPCTEDELLIYLKNAHKLAMTEFGSQFDFSHVRKYIFICLHIMREEYKLDVNCGGDVKLLGKLLGLHAWVGKWNDKWKAYYEVDLDLSKMKYIACNLQQPLESPPSILQSIYSFFTGPVVPFPTLSELGYLSVESDVEVTPKIVTSLRILQAMSIYDIDEVLSLITLYGLTISDIQQYTEAVRLPIMEVLMSNSFNVTGLEKEEMYKLLGREDLCKMIESDFIVPTHHNSDHSTSHLAGELPIPKDIRSIVQNATEHDSLIAWDDQVEADRIAISRLLFNQDRRFHEVSKLLQSSRIQVATVFHEPLWNEQDWLGIQQWVSKRTSLRTLSTAMGRAALFYSARNPLVTEKYPIPKMNFSLLIKPDNVTVPVQKSFLADEQLQWGLFHNGVSSGMSVARDATHISGSWIVFNQPDTLTPQHSGFLLGLGLNGHLKKLEEWHIYNYLGPKHDYTSIALLIGMAASQLGSMNTKLTKVLSVHVEALLPIGSSDLKVATAVQSAGSIGIGLLYCGSQHRRMTEVFLNEVDVSKSRTANTGQDEETVEKDEGYRLSAGISLGLINLAKGASRQDSHVVERLLELALMPRDVQTSLNMDQSVSGALMALCLMFMKSNMKAVASKIEIPDTEHRYDYIRPDFLHLRALAKHLIMWDSIGNDHTWIEKNIPVVLSARVDIRNNSALDGDNLAYFNVLSGLCLAMGMRWAGSADEEVKMTLLYYLDALMRLSEEEGSTKDQDMTKLSLLNNLSCICLAVCAVMAGTGDLDIFRRLRRIYSRIRENVPPVGLYMTNQMGMGILFLGGGQYSFGRNPLAIAAMVISFHPLLAEKMNENRFYLQPLRHIWALAAENRCLIVRDVRTNEPISIDVEIEPTAYDEPISYLRSPCLIPELDTISKITTRSGNHFEVCLDLANGAERPLVEAFQKNLTIWVKKKPINETLSIGTKVGFLVDNESMTDTRRLGRSLEWMKEVIPLEYTEKRGLFALNGTQMLSLLTFTAESYISTGLQNSPLDCKLILGKMAQSPETVDDYLNLRILLKFSDSWKVHDDLVYLPAELMEELRILLVGRGCRA